MIERAWAWAQTFPPGVRHRVNPVHGEEEIKIVLRETFENLSQDIEEVERCGTFTIQDGVNKGVSGKGPENDYMQKVPDTIVLAHVQPPLENLSPVKPDRTRLAPFSSQIFRILAMWPLAAVQGRMRIFQSRMSMPQVLF